MVLMFVFVVPPVGYGWGYRGWGAPYPRYFQRRRAQQALVNGGSTSFDHHAWGWGGDALWIMVVVWILCAVAATWWR
jgi:hypothetical protein